MANDQLKSLAYFSFFIKVMPFSPLESMSRAFLGRIVERRDDLEMGEG